MKISEVIQLQMIMRSKMRLGVGGNTRTLVESKVTSR